MIPIHRVLVLLVALSVSLAAQGQTKDTTKKDSPKKKDGKKKTGKKDSKKPPASKTVTLDSLDISRTPKFKVTSEPSARSQKKLEEVIDQFEVETRKRYLPRNGATFCNIFARDFCTAMGVKLPWDLANSLYDWLPSSKGKAAGWKAATPAEAQKAANEGRPALVVWKNNTFKTVKTKDGTEKKVANHGHIAVIRPSTETGGPFIAQAGGKNFNNIAVGKVFKGGMVKTTKYYVNK